MESLKCNWISGVISIYSVYLNAHFILSGQENVFTHSGSFSNLIKKKYTDFLYLAVL